MVPYVLLGLRATAAATAMSIGKARHLQLVELSPVGEMVPHVLLGLRATAAATATLGSGVLFLQHVDFEGL